MNVKKEVEIRAYVSKPELVLSKCHDLREYTLKDKFYKPISKSISEWDPKYVSMRIRDFGGEKKSLIYSKSRYRGRIKESEKITLHEASMSELEQMLESWGFEHLFDIVREKGYFLKHEGKDFAMEKIVGLGWMVDIDIAEGENPRDILGGLGIDVECMIDESLASLFYKKYYKKY